MGVTGTGCLMPAFYRVFLSGFGWVFGGGGASLLWLPVIDTTGGNVWRAAKNRSPTAPPQCRWPHRFGCQPTPPPPPCLLICFPVFSSMTHPPSTLFFSPLSGLVVDNAIQLVGVTKHEMFCSWKTFGASLFIENLKGTIVTGLWGL